MGGGEQAARLAAGAAAGRVCFALVLSVGCGGFAVGVEAGVGAGALVGCGGGGGRPAATRKRAREMAGVVVVAVWSRAGGRSCGGGSDCVGVGCGCPLLAGWVVGRGGGGRRSRGECSVWGGGTVAARCLAAVRGGGEDEAVVAFGVACGGGAGGAAG